MKIEIKINIYLQPVRCKRNTCFLLLIRLPSFILPIIISLFGKIRSNKLKVVSLRTEIKISVLKVEKKLT